MSAEQLRRRWRRFVLGGVLALALVVSAALLHAELSPRRVMLAGLAVLPLLAALAPLARGGRRTYAWMSLLVIPYLVFSITETIANPAARLWSALCLIVSFVVFVALIGYLRVSRTTAEPAR